MTRRQEVEVAIGSIRLGGSLSVPDRAKGIVVFAHGSGSSRHSPRNNFVADQLNDAGLGTLLFDLLTQAEERDRKNVFDIPMLGGRLLEVTSWLRDQPEAEGLPIGYFGASTGAGAALVAAAEAGTQISAVVSRGGRPDLAKGSLPDVIAPTLLIVGGRDEVVEQLNREAEAQMRCERELAIISGATHLFEEPGTLEEVASFARDWFLQHFTPKGSNPGQKSSEPDPLLEKAGEEAEGTDLYEDAYRTETLRAAREEAQGVEVFEEPDAEIPVAALKEGSPGHETLTGDALGRGRDGEDERPEEGDEDR
jgi:predicted alpha/beta-hydrolase family hydrolase